jgi:hypothetical protein
VKPKKTANRLYLNPKSKMRKLINRTSFYDENIKRIDILDNRFYIHSDNPEIYYPSTTTILEAFPKGYELEQWHKALGFNADIVLKKASDVGTHVHDAINNLVNGNPVNFGSIIDDDLFTNYSLEEWQMICKFVEFWESYKPRLIASEVKLISDTYKLGCTVDLICEIILDNKSEIWHIDHKTSNSIHDSAELQLAANSMMWNETNPDTTIDRCGILHLKALTRGESKQGKVMQGNGWKIHEFDRHYGDAFKTFKAVRKIWDEQNPNYKPKNLSYPTVLKLTKTS